MAAGVTRRPVRRAGPLDFDGDERLVRFVESEWPPDPEELEAYQRALFTRLVDHPRRAEMAVIFARTCSFGRWQQARRDWFTAHGVPWEDQPACLADCSTYSTLSQEWRAELWSNVDPAEFARLWDASRIDDT
jgi:hypothetical protein